MGKSIKDSIRKPIPKPTQVIKSKKKKIKDKEDFKEIQQYEMRIEDVN